MERITYTKENENQFPKWRKACWEHRYLILVSALLLYLAYILTYLAGNYVLGVKGVSAPDILLDNLPTIDLHFIYTYGIIFVLGFLIIYTFIFRIKLFHELLCQISFLIILRAAFMILTHLSNPADALQFMVPKYLFFLNFQNDLFFSAHTALPFLGFLFFKNKIRYFFLASSVIMGLTVLLMHVHYTIDVVSAFFIAYCSFSMVEWFFDKIEGRSA